MKKLFFYAASAAMVLASCSSDDFVGENNNSSKLSEESQAIVFNSGFKAVTRADAVGADAAAKLNNKFIVSGFKGDGAAMSTVFDNYIVNWTENTAGKTESNTSDWEYVGTTAAAPSAITGEQTIKYWDYSTSQYDFAAFSYGDKTLITTGSPSTGQVLISTNGITKNATYAGPTFSLTGATDDLAACYISDLVTAYKASDYQKEVTLSFRSLGAKVRVAFYETVPGYSVKNVYFYQNNATTIGTDISSNTSATLIGTNFYSSGTYTITYPHIGSSNVDNSDYNKAHVTVGTGATSSTTQAFGSLNYRSKHDREKTEGNVFLGIASNNPTYAGTTDPYYTTVLPNEAGQVLELRVDYTLEAVDGSREEITVHGAKAFVPATYTAWLPNYAYTYIFKISDNTNGWTSTTTTDPAGLYPITFDAVVVDDVANTQSTITTVATPSITTYQKGHDITKNEYAEGDIYVQVMDDGTLATNLTTENISKLYTLGGKAADYKYTEADVMDALNIQASTETGTITGRNGVILTDATITNNITTIPGEDGNNIIVTEGTAAKFTAEAPTSPATVKYYAYVYDTGTDNADSYIYSAVNFAAGDAAPADWAGNYWDNPDGTGAAVTDFDGTNKITYYRRYTNNNRVYGVKVIKVE